jgi:UDP-N-acetylglucosamine:LPS N-acetylglucosamine transferase
MLNLFVWFGGFLMKYFLSRKIQAAFHSMFSIKQPDMVISLVPYYNTYAIRAFDDKKPFIIVCCDIDIRGYLFNWQKIYYKNLLFCMPVISRKNRLYLEARCVEKKQTRFIGYPLRKGFYRKPLENIQNDTITLLLGGQGSVKCLQYLKKLITYKYNITINVCIGYNETLVSKIKKLPTPGNIRINTITFTENIVDILAVSDLIITKTGSCSIYETLSLQKPILMDCTSTQLSWERENIAYVEKLGVGMPIVKLDDCVPMVEAILCSETKRKTIEKNYNNLNAPDFFGEFIKLLEEQ